MRSVWLRAVQGVRQGCFLAPSLLNNFATAMLKIALAPLFLDHHIVF